MKKEKIYRCNVSLTLTLSLGEKLLMVKLEKLQKDFNPSYFLLSEYKSNCDATCQEKIISKLLHYHPIILFENIMNLSI